MQQNPKGYANPELLIAPADLAGRLGLSGGDRLPVTLIDLRPAEDYAAGHLPGAVHLDLFGVSLIDTSSGPLDAFLWIIVHLLVSRGVSRDTPVIVYDEQSGIRAARALWFLEFFEHPHAQLLDGGYAAWAREGFLTTTTSIAPDKGDWSVGRGVERLATWQDVQDRLGRADVVMLDTRSDGEYYGTTIRAKRGGAVPGAIHIEWTRNLSPDGSYKPADELSAMYLAHGVTADREVVAYCQGGYRAAHSYLALRLLGYPKVRNYLGSWKEWGDREDLPIVQPRSDEI